MPNSGGELKLHLSTINVTKTLAIGYCVPENATIEVQLNWQFLEASIMASFMVCERKNCRCSWVPVN